MKRWLCVFAGCSMALASFGEVPANAEGKAAADSRPTGAIELNLEHLKTLAAKDDAVALLGLGNAYYTGLGAPQNFEEAFSYLQKAAEKGQLPAAISLAKMLAAGQGTKADPAKALFWATVALDGMGLSDAGKKDLAALKENLEKSVPTDARENVAKEAKEWLANRKKGQAFTPTPDLQAKAGEIQKKAESGDAFAQFQLGNLIFMGYGFPQDYTQAVNWYKKSAEKGYWEAQLSLGLMFHQGLGAAADQAEAYFWLKTGFKDLPAGKGIWESFRLLPEEISVGLSNEQMEALKNRIESWKPAK